MLNRTPDVPRESKVKVDGHDLSYRSRNFDGPCILAIHGLGLDKDLFSGLWPFVMRSPYSALVPDMLGHGNSSKHENEIYSVEQQVDLIYKAILGRAGRGVHVVGHSVGGAVALLVAQRLEDKLLSYVTLEGNLIPSDCGTVSRDTATYSEDTFRTMIFPLEHSNATNCLDVAFYRLSKSVVEICDFGFRGRSLLDILSSLPGQKLYMHGADTACNIDVIPMLVRRGVKIETVQGAGHCFMQENAAATYPILFNFFDRSSVTEEKK